MSKREEYETLLETGEPVRYIYYADLDDDLTDRIEGYAELEPEERIELLKKYMPKYAEKYGSLLGQVCTLPGVEEPLEESFEEFLDEFLGERL